MSFAMLHAPWTLYYLIKISNYVVNEVKLQIQNTIYI
jgi:hypothetical protein